VTSRPIRVLYLAHTFSVGGAEEMVLNLVRHLPARFAPAICCIHEAGPIGEEIRKDRRAVFELGRPRACGGLLMPCLRDAIADRPRHRAHVPADRQPLRPLRRDDGGRAHRDWHRGEHHEKQAPDARARGSGG
jgi:hypothetical protein